MDTLTVNELVKLRQADLNLLCARVNVAMGVVSLLRNTRFVESGIDGVGPTEVAMNQFERGAYNASLETLRLWVSGELGAPVHDDDLPGPDLAVKYPPPPPAPTDAKPRQAGPVMAFSGGMLARSHELGA